MAGDLPAKEDEDNRPGTPNFNGLTPAETERLAILMEEASEVVKVCAKILRHGWAPTDRSVSPVVAYDNRHDLELEMGDYAQAQEMMLSAGDVGGGGNSGRADRQSQHRVAPTAPPNGARESLPKLRLDQFTRRRLSGRFRHSNVRSMPCNSALSK